MKKQAKKKSFSGAVSFLHNDVNVNELVFSKMMTVVGKQPKNNWIGTMSKLRTALERFSSHHQREILPGSPSALRVVINRIANRLRSRGIGIKFGRTPDHARTRFVRFTH